MHCMRRSPYVVTLNRGKVFVLVSQCLLIADCTSSPPADLRGVFLSLFRHAFQYLQLGPQKLLASCQYFYLLVQTFIAFQRYRTHQCFYLVIIAFEWLRIHCAKTHIIRKFFTLPIIQLLVS